MGRRVPPQPVAQIFISIPPPPTPGSVSLSPTGPVAGNSNLTATLSGWSGTIPGVTVYEYSWERTNTNTPTCSGAFGLWDTNQTTNSTNTDQVSSVRCYRVRVRAYNVSGTWSGYTAAYSNVVTVLDPPQPGSVGITGANPQAAGTMTATTLLSGWSGSPTSITFEWQRAAVVTGNCPSSGSNSWGNFSGNSSTVAATSPSTLGTLTTSSGFCYRVRVRGTNAVGTGNFSGYTNPGFRVT